MKQTTNKNAKIKLENCDVGDDAFAGVSRLQLPPIFNCHFLQVQKGVLLSENDCSAWSIPPMNDIHVAVSVCSCTKEYNAVLSTVRINPLSYRMNLYLGLSNEFLWPLRSWIIFQTDLNRSVDEKKTSSKLLHFKYLLRWIHPISTSQLSNNMYLFFSSTFTQRLSWRFDIWICEVFHCFIICERMWLERCERPQ